MKTMNNQENMTQSIAKEIYEYAADLMLVQGRSVKRSKELLVEKGLEAKDADIIIMDLKEQIKKMENREAEKDILFGALWFFGGLSITITTYMTASENGGTYLVTWGAIAFGAVQLFRGLLNRIS